MKTKISNNNITLLILSIILLLVGYTGCSLFSPYSHGVIYLLFEFLIYMIIPLLSFYIVNSNKKYTLIFSIILSCSLSILILDIEYVISIIILSTCIYFFKKSLTKQIIFGIITLFIYTLAILLYCAIIKNTLYDTKNSILSVFINDIYSIMNYNNSSLLFAIVKYFRSLSALLGFIPVYFLLKNRYTLMNTDI